MSKHSVWGILTAAGTGARMQRNVPKQYLTILNKTIIEHTLYKLACLKLKGLVVVIARHDRYWAKLSVSMPFPLLTTLGGSERYHSVYNGVRALESIGVSGDDFILVHDAARPCVSVADIEKLINAVHSNPAGGLLAVPAFDTLKQSKSQAQGLSLVNHTVDRTHIWHAQTPQIFPLKRLHQGLEQAVKQDLNITDEASVVEMLGDHPVMIEGSRLNIKVTTEEDLWLAEAILHQQYKC